MVATALPPDNLHGGDMLLDTGAIPLSSSPPSSASPSPFSQLSSFSCPLINSQPPVRAVDADQLFRLHQKFVSTPLPSKSMFPWLHGVDGTSGTQNYFFGIEPQHYTGTNFENNASVRTGPTATKLPIPEHRGLMFIHASDLDPGRLVGSVSPSEILQLAPRHSPSPFGSQSSTNGITNNSPKGLPLHNGVQQDINNHPQIHHQYSSVPSAQQQNHYDVNQGGAGRDSDWADISDDSTSSSLSSSSLSSTTSNAVNATFFSTTSTGANSNNSGSNAGSIYQSSFVQSLSEGINIRNFKIQVPRYALLSDMIIYSKEGEQDLILLQLAKHISAAQDEVWRAMKEQYPQLAPEARRQTFVLTDTFAAFEAKYPELVAVSSSGRASRNKVDFWEQEREQMALLTRASEIAPGVWLGNNVDVPVVNTGASSLATPVSPGTSFSSYFFPAPSIPSTLSQQSSATKLSAIPSTPPPDEGEYPPLAPPSFNDHSSFHPSICIECRSGPNAPTTMTLDRIKNNVSCAPAPLATREIFHLECLGTLTAGIPPETFPPSTSSLSSFARAEHVDISANHERRRAIAASLVRGQQVSNSMLQAQITQLINMAFFINSVVAPESSSISNDSSNGFGNRGISQQQYAHQVLIHCVDGYTESALLALAVVMIHYRLSLAEAYVKLQTDLGRSFFVYPNDAIVSLEVENQIWHRILLEKTEREAATKWKSAGSTANLRSASSSAVPVPELNGSGSSTTSSGMSSLSSSLSSSSSSFFSSLLSISSTAVPQQRQDGPQTPTSPTMPSIAMMEGIESMPDRDEELARQRPYAKPEHEEQFDWFYHPEFEGSFPSRILPFLYLGNLAHASNPGLLKSLGIRYVLSVGEEAHGLNEDVRSMPSLNRDGEIENMPDATPSRFMVKLVDDMFDNGVDSLWKHLENCVAFVDEARKANSRILIHCRVGVSRSATIVIAYLMAHYNLSLVDAYLMVRARRLSVIIQPNLLFMYELLQWEQRLRGRFDPMGWPGIAREVHSLNMYYIGN
ncbi:tyrosine/serine/threonine protein phosphatase pps1 [Mortierella sp. AM989]|nr:tyrosine/serine/threonine protein phosphatase pps1 [Mortierella sp. AM989]